MNELTINGTKNTLNVVFDTEKKKISITGMSLPENPSDFFELITQRLDLFMLKITNKLIVEFDIKYMNTSSSKNIYNFIRKCVQLVPNVEIVWCYESDDEEMYDSGLSFEEVSGVNFKFREIN